MCGIFGYVGNRAAAPLLIAGLRTLEYRGYDSAGVFIPGSVLIKSVGPIDNLEAKIPESILGTTGIAHTRWATHGAPTEANAHPHLDMSQSIAIVHNGIIENFRELREGLVAQGITFSSDTDTEVLAKLIGSLYSGNLFEAVQRALTLVRGTYGLVVSSVMNPEQLVVARLGSPIVLGVAAHGNFVASDPSALLTHTKNAIYLKDGECAVVKADSYQVYAKDGLEISRAIEVIDWDVQTIQKKGYEHFMLKEIFEAPEVIENAIRGRLISKLGKAKLGGLEGERSRLAMVNRMTIVGCGSAYYAGQVGRHMLEEYAGLPTEVELGSEYRYKRNLSDKNSGVLAISQSGETADTLAAVRMAKELDLLTLGVVNVVGSTIAREVDAGVYNHAGPEVAVASTKAFISQLTTLALITLFIGRERGLSLEEGKQIVAELERLPNIVRSYLLDTNDIKAIAEKYARYRDIMYIGRKLHAPIACEGSLKLKEVTYIHAEAYAGGELKHGPIALLDEHFPVIALAPQDEVYEKIISNIEEVRARKAPVLVIANVGDTKIAQIADDVLYVPTVHPILQPILTTIPLQLLAYYIGIEKGFNVDRPRNLAKSVTVE